MVPFRTPLQGELPLAAGSEAPVELLQSAHPQRVVPGTPQHLPHAWPAACHPSHCHGFHFRGASDDCLVSTLQAAPQESLRKPNHHRRIEFLVAQQDSDLLLLDQRLVFCLLPFRPVAWKSVRVESASERRLLHGVPRDWVSLLESIEGPSIRPLPSISCFGA